METSPALESMLLEPIRGGNPIMYLNIPQTTPPKTTLKDLTGKGNDIIGLVRIWIVSIGVKHHHWLRAFGLTPPYTIQHLRTTTTL